MNRKHKQTILYKIPSKFLSCMNRINLRAGHALVIYPRVKTTPYDAREHKNWGGA